MKKNLMVLSSLVLSFAPMVAFAAASKCLPNSADVSNIICKIGEILNSIIPILILLGVVYFVWGVITYVISSDEEAKKAGRDRIIFGIIGLAVIVAMWGLVNIPWCRYPIIEYMIMMDLFSTKIAYADFNSLLKNINGMIINPLITFLFALAILFFLYGVFEFIMNQENEEKKTTGKNHIIWGIIGITIMLGVWTILGMVLATFNIEGINLKEGTVQLR